MTGRGRSAPCRSPKATCSRSPHIEPYLGGVLAQLAAEQHLRGLDRDPFIDRLTHYLAELNATHPFREGNGRTQRPFVQQLAEDAGYHIDWRTLDPQENIDASGRRTVVTTSPYERSSPSSSPRPNKDEITRVLSAASHDNTNALLISAPPAPDATLEPSAETLKPRSLSHRRSGRDPLGRRGIARSAPIRRQLLCD